MKTVDAFVKHPHLPGATSEPPPVPLITPENILLLLIDKAKTFDADLNGDWTDETSSGPPSSVDEDQPKQIGCETSAYDELFLTLKLLNEEQMIEILALTWVGRGDYDRGEWRTALEDARDAYEDRDIVAYLTGTPLLSDYLEEGLAVLGHDSNTLERLTV